ncbi:MAG: helix-turn-helix domain-containing protein [Verrucomicrobiales bacterium]|nr:helix-turn-helix domain-containing protein [Verrucomicrobiales bacterium]
MAPGNSTPNVRGTRKPGGSLRPSSRQCHGLTPTPCAELIRTGRCNVTEAALEVGYNSLSHFSAAFREQFRLVFAVAQFRHPRASASPRQRIASCR